jgi:hypothetical protein
MAKSHGLVGAACMCLFLAGCTLDSFSLSELVTAKGDGGPVVAGSLDVVTASTQKALGDMGLFVRMNRDGETARLSSKTPGGKGFTLLLKARKTDHGDETQVSVQWEKEADDAFWLQLGAVLARSNATAAPALSEAPPR